MELQDSLFRRTSTSFRLVLEESGEEEALWGSFFIALDLQSAEGNQTCDQNTSQIRRSTTENLEVCPTLSSSCTTPDPVSMTSQKQAFTGEPHLHPDSVRAGSKMILQVSINVLTVLWSVGLKSFRPRRLEASQRPVQHLLQQLLSALCRRRELLLTAPSRLLVQRKEDASHTSTFSSQHTDFSLAKHI